ncbi:Ribonuclease/ribotoxin [Metarhizium robertsii ARSEF 23]|uniref:Ribonuclease/ribotoxin n=1 Tax=Metarhizium robertsii (strain ARSEF 23 / ATCC MYA-3075) TaxID=655844 RepID=A0A0B2XDC3_METRA|nr:Ribonuclease/ribotoxin [Metarhizium robertsii ARSEF 23]KHO10725.1 Ribonuclease/ribotoxin [Metarhizium robertsii ARSEF 23]
MPREDKRDKRHWQARQQDIDCYWTGRQAFLNGHTDDAQLHFDRISSLHGQKYAKKLLEDEHGDIAAALDKVLDAPGLRAGYWPKLMHKVIYIKCNEQIIAYLEFIKHTWDFIAGSAAIDIKTVQALENKCPRYSKEDGQNIATLIDRALIFEHCDASWRNDLKQRLTQLPFAIPSLDSFFDDIKVLGDCSRSMSNLFDRKKHETFTSALKRTYFGDENCFQDRLADMWLIVLRFYSKTQPPPRRAKIQLREKPRHGSPDTVILQFMSISAQKLGFKSVKLSNLANPLNDSAAESRHTSLILATSSSPKLVQEESVPYKFGYPDIQSFESDQFYLRWDKFNADATPGTHMSTFGRLRGLCLAFFRSTTRPYPVFPPIDSGGIQVGSVPTKTAQSPCRVNNIGQVNEEQYNDIQMYATEQTVEQDEVSKQRKRKAETKGPVCVCFKEHKGYEWRDVLQIEGANEDKVQGAAAQLFQDYYLVRAFWNHTMHRVELGTINIPDCWKSAQDSGINAILLVSKRKELDLDFLSDRAAHLYSK